MRDYALLKRKKHFRMTKDFTWKAYTIKYKSGLSYSVKQCTSMNYCFIEGIGGGPSGMYALYT